MLRAKDLFEKTCKHCGLIFETDKARAYVCPTCQKKTKAKNQVSFKKEVESKTKKKESPAVTILEMAKKIENYNREHKTNYSYGQYMELVNSGKIRL